jgi:acetyl esterase
MTVDAQVQMIIDGMNASGVSEFAELGHIAVREMCESMLLPFDAGALASVEDKSIPVNSSTNITVRIYKPMGEGAFPLIVYFHGGGWSIGSINTHDPICRALSAWAKAVVVSVHYRLSPEFPFPIPLEDCYQATLWAQQHAKELNADASRLTVAGDSAGGNLAAVVCLLARDRKLKGETVPAINHQLLLYPITDADFETKSYKENANGYVLRRSDMQWFWDQYIKNPAERKNPYASPLQADLKNLPPATVITAQYDTLRDEGNAYAKKLQTAGVKVTHREIQGMIHGFIGFAGLVDKGREVLKECAKKISSP